MGRLKAVSSIKSLIKIVSFCIAFLVFIFPEAHGFTPQSDSPLARKEHPRLHLTEKNIPKIRAAISSDSELRSLYQDYVVWAETADTSDKGNGIGGCGHSIFRAYMLDWALIAAIGQVDGISYPRSPEWYADKAISELDSGAGSGDLGFVGALVYDWTFNYMTPSERSSIADRLSQMNLCHKEFSATMRSPQITPTRMFSSKYLEGFYAFYIGLALWGDGFVDSYADIAVETFYDDFLNYGYLDAQSFSGEGGGWSEWIGYSSWHPSRHILNVDAWRTATGEDYISGNGIRVQPEYSSAQIKNYAKFLHYAIDPHRYLPAQGSPLSFNEFTFVRTGGASTIDTRLAHSEKKRELRLLPGQYMDADLATEAGLARDFLERYEVELPGHEYYYSWIFLGARGYPEPLSPIQAGLPKSFWARNHGTFFARTGFTSEADTVFTVNDGHFRYNGHSGPNRWPGFSLNKFGPLVNTRYVAHRGYGNLEDYEGAFRYNVIDFGVAEKYVELRDPPDLEAAIKGQGDYDLGGIEQVTALEDKFYHIRSDRSRAYEGGISHTREYVWFPGQEPLKDQDFLVIYDRTYSSGKPRWTYHVPWKPTASGYSSSSSMDTGSGVTDRKGTKYTGSGIIIEEFNGLGGEDDLEYNDVIYDYVGGSQAHGVMFSKTLLPEQSEVEVTRVAKLDDATLRRQDFLAIKSHRWQISVKPVQVKTEHRFLHVFQTGDANKVDHMVESYLIDGGKEMQGVFIEQERSDRPHYVVLFHKTEGVNNSSVGYSINTSGPVRHVITGLKPQTLYNIEIASDSGVAVINKATEAQMEVWDYKGVATNIATGTLYFETFFKGNQRLSITQSGKPSKTVPAEPSNLRILHH